MQTWWNYNWCWAVPCGILLNLPGLLTSVFLIPVGPFKCTSGRSTFPLTFSEVEGVKKICSRKQYYQNTTLGLGMTYPTLCKGKKEQEKYKPEWRIRIVCMHVPLGLLGCVFLNKTKNNAQKTRVMSILNSELTELTQDSNLQNICHAWAKVKFQASFPTLI